MRSYIHIFIAVLGIITLLMGRPDLACANRVGGGPYEFLKLGVGGRAMALGGAFRSVADDGTATYWNPAGIGYQGKRVVTFMLTVTQPGSGVTDPKDVSNKHMFGSVIYPHPPIPFLRKAIIGISFIQFSVGDIPYTTDNGFGDVRRLGVLTNKQQAIVLSLGAKALELKSVPVFHVGGSVKYLTHSISGAGFSVSARPSNFIGGVDFGVIGNVSGVRESVDDPFFWLFRDVKLGLVVSKNFPKKWNTGREETDPINVGLGLSSVILRRGQFELMWALDSERTSSSPFDVSSGLELRLVKVGAVDMVAVRAGMNNYYLTGTPDIPKTELNLAREFCLGGGVKARMIQADAAYVIGRFINRFRISVGLIF